MNTRQLSRIAILAAIYVVLSLLTPIKLLNFKFTFEAFPILIAGLLFGPIDGMLCATIGSFIYQLLFSGYGLTITTPLWMLPHIISGLVVGLFAKRKKFDLNKNETILITIISCLLVTLFNSLAMYIDSLIFKYSIAIWAMLPFRIIAGIILAIIYSLIIPRFKKIIKTKTGI